MIIGEVQFPCGLLHHDIETCLVLIVLTEETHPFVGKKSNFFTWQFSRGINIEWVTNFGYPVFELQGPNSENVTSSDPFLRASAHLGSIPHWTTGALKISWVARKPMSFF
jgi:hypothetical protein